MARTKAPRYIDSKKATYSPLNGQGTRMPCRLVEVARSCGLKETTLADGKKKFIPTSEKAGVRMTMVVQYKNSDGEEVLRNTNFFINMTADTQDGGIAIENFKFNEFCDIFDLSQKKRNAFYKILNDSLEANFEDLLDKTLEPVANGGACTSVDEVTGEPHIDETAACAIMMDLVSVDDCNTIFEMFKDIEVLVDVTTYIAGTDSEGNDVHRYTIVRSARQV